MTTALLAWGATGAAWAADVYATVSTSFPENYNPFMHNVYGPGGEFDSDGDGVNDVMDNFPHDQTEYLDSDRDGVGDNADAFPDDFSRTTDDDQDGIDDLADNCVGLFNPEQADTDMDGIGDACAPTTSPYADLLPPPPNP